MPPKIRPIAKPIGPQVGQQNIQDQEAVFAPDPGSPLSGGMDTFNDGPNVSTSRFTNEKNVTNRNAFLSRRAGSVAITPTKPNSDKVLSFYTTTDFNQNVIQLRITKGTIYARSGGSWNEFDYNSIAFTGGDNDRFNTVTTTDRVFTSNSGVDPIRELDCVNNKILALGNAPRFRYLAVIANRLVGAYLEDDTSPNPTLVGWSGDINFGEWDPNTDFSAGSVPLIDSQSNYSEFITGIFGFESKLLVVRQRSLVVGTLQPSATDPFYFYTAVPGVGSDTPNSIQKVPNGVMFYDRRTRRVYRYDVNNGLDDQIGLLVNDTITSQVIDNTLLYSSYDPINHEYQLCIPSGVSTIVRIWTFNEITRAWSYDELNNISSIDNVDFSLPSTTIGDLIGTIGDLAGTIADLSPAVSTSTRFYSTTTGDILSYDDTLDTDDGSIYETIIESKTYELPKDDIYVGRLRLEMIIRKDTTMSLYYSKDNGINYTLYKTVTLSSSTNRQLIIASKNIKARQLKWKIVCTTGLWDIVNYEVHAALGSPSRH